MRQPKASYAPTYPLPSMIESLSFSSRGGNARRQAGMAAIVAPLPAADERQRFLPAQVRKPRLSKTALFFKIEVGDRRPSLEQPLVWRNRQGSVRSSGVARLFRFVEKKRGERRTGSNLVGSLGEAIFCGSLFLLGSLLLSVIVGTQLLQPDPGQFAFGVGGWLLILVTGSSVVLGGGGLIWTVVRVGTSLERRSAMANQAADTDIVHAAVPRPRNYPTLPPFDGLTNSPGIELAYRLPPAQTPGWQLLAITIFAMLWNFVVCLLTVSVISGHIAGLHEWLLTVLLIPFWFVCYW